MDLTGVHQNQLYDFIHGIYAGFAILEYIQKISDKMHDKVIDMMRPRIELIKPK